MTTNGYAMIGLDNPKNSINVGSALRACGCYGAVALAISGDRTRHIGNASTDTQNQYKRIPVFRGPDLSAFVPFDCVPVAIDIIDGAIPLQEYKHPVRAFYVFGAEDATLGDRVISWCRDIVYVPTVFCMNLAATVNVILYDRMAKMQGET